eukprot:SAG22_NODE_886_length_6665_cov_3.040359_9_plen_113_part_00
MRTLAGAVGGAGAGRAGAGGAGAGGEVAAAATPAPTPSATSAAAVRNDRTGYVKLGQRVRECEQRWCDDCFRVASEECRPESVSLVGISGPLRNSQLLYGDMCAVGCEFATA